MSSSTTHRPTGSISGPEPSNGLREKTFFEQQRDALVGEIAVSLEHVLQNINKLNRSLEGVIAVGNEFGSVEALWSQFENVMARDPDTEGQVQEEQEAGEGEEVSSITHDVKGN